jgi:hypothetical protein
LSRLSHLRLDSTSSIIASSKPSRRSAHSAHHMLHSSSYDYDYCSTTGTSIRGTVRPSSSIIHHPSTTHLRRASLTTEILRKLTGAVRHDGRRRRRRRRRRPWTRTTVLGDQQFRFTKKVSKNCVPSSLLLPRSSGAVGMSR